MLLRVILVLGAVFFFGQPVSSVVPAPESPCALHLKSEGYRLALQRADKQAHLNDVEWLNTYFRRYLDQRVLVSAFDTDGTYEQTIQSLEQAIELCEPVYGKNSVWMADAHSRLAIALIRDPENQRSHHIRALKTAEAVFGNETPEIIPYLRRRGHHHLSWEGRGGRYLNTAVRIARRDKKVDPLQFGLALFDQGRLRAAENKFSLAIESYREALQVLEAALPQADQHLMKVRAFLVLALSTRGQDDDANQEWARLSAQMATKTDVVTPLVHVLPLFRGLAGVRHHEGYTVLSLNIGEDGRISEAAVLDPGPESRLAASALSASGTWIYRPTTGSDAPVAQVRVEFLLDIDNRDKTRFKF